MSDKPKSQIEAPSPSGEDGEGELAAASDSDDDIPVEVEADGDGDGEAGQAGAEVDESPEAHIARLEEEKAAVAAEKRDIWDRLLRSTADLENLRKRSKREVSDARTAARTEVLKEMLPIVDNLERAIEHAAESGGNGAEGGILDGVKLVLRQFEQALERCEVQPVEALGKPFDPNVHDAMGQLETAEHAPGTVAQVYQKGYTIADKLLRPALVVVAKAPAEAEADAGGEGNGAAPEEGNGADHGPIALPGEDEDATDADGGGEETR